MITTPNRFLVAPEKNKTPLDSASVEFIVAPLAALASAKDAPQKLTADSARWNPALVAQFERQRKEKKGDSTCSIVVRFEGGGTACFLFVAPKTTTHDLQGEMREAFDKAIKRCLESEEPVRARLDIRRLRAEDQKRVLQAFTIFGGTIGWEPTQFGKSAQEAEEKRKKRQPEIPCGLLSGLKPAEAIKVTEVALAQASAINSVRSLAELPANELNPRNYRKHVEKFAETHGLECEYWDVKELTKRKAGAFLAVARADSQAASGIAKLVYRPAKVVKSRPPKKLALIGKGMCFDTGGYNIKGGEYMLGMHGDMTGSAVALSLIGMYAELKVDFEVHAYLAIAENLISPTAYKPNEVVIACDGTAIEVVDTDAEGRMVLADTLALARREKPDMAIDFATLTGAAIRALDRRRSAVFSNREPLAKLAVDCGDASGERTWTFPIGGDYRKQLKSKIADILQCASGRNADHIYAATFLSQFIGDEVPWVHVDLAACENKGGLGLIATDTTGFGVLWAQEFVTRALAKNW